MLVLVPVLVPVLVLVLVLVLLVPRQRGQSAATKGPRL